MANKVQLKAAGDQDFTDNDPFAELTRIMGFDPRVQPTPRPDEDFEIDLEKELMGMFDPGSDAPAEPASVRDYPQEAVDNAAAPREATADDIDEAFAAKLEEELSGDTDFWSEEQGTAAADEEPQPLDAHSSQDTRLGEVDDIMAEVDMDFGSSQPEDSSREAEADDAGGWVADEDDGVGDRIVDAPMVEDAMSSEEGPEEGNVFRPTFFTPLDADRPSTGGTLTTGYAPSAQDMEQAGPAVAPVFDIRSFKSAAQQYREAQPRYEVTFADERVADEPAEESPAPRAKAVDPFDILAALGTERALPQRRDPLKAPVPEADSFEEPEQPAESVGFMSDEAPTRQDYVPQDYSQPDHASQEFGEWETASRQGVDAAGQNWESGAGALEQPQEPVAEEVVSASFDDMPFFDIRPAGGINETTAASSEDQPEYESRAASTSGKADAPDIETTEIEDPAVSIADDLDIPVPAFLTEAHPAPVYDDLDEEFEHAFQALSANTEAIRQAAVTPEQPSVAQASADIERLFAEELGIGGAAAAAPAAALSAAAAGQAATTQRAGDDFEEFDFDDTDFLPDEFANFSREADDGFAAGDTGAARFLPRQARFPVGRGKLVAAAVAGVVVLGGIGVFAFSGSGTATSDKPVVLKADADPVKVKPKNPGGVTVPNQDNKVYERVADGATAVAPEQKKLVSTEEQPVDISAQAKGTATALPGVFEGDQITPLKSAPSDDNSTASGGDAAASLSAAVAKGDIADIIKATPKGEDRLTPTQDTTREKADADVLSVTPHKVKTMIVRADGTMVPREDPVPADAGVKTAEADAVVSTDLPPAAPIPTQEPQTVKATETAAKPAERSQNSQVNTPAKVAAAPTRPADQPADVAGVKPQKVASAEASPKPAPVTEASGSWSVQIASQPTAEAAQTSYQNMARRYADILGGHAANIVKADIAGKGTYYRVRIAANSKDDAIALCTKYKAAGGNCFVSK
jgi:hypothetical protein